MIDKTINLLGLPATDKVTGITGTITSVSFELYGCVQAWVAPKAGADGKVPDSQWFDVSRLDVGTERVMPVPNFASRAPEPAAYDHGPESKGPPAHR